MKFSPWFKASTPPIRSGYYDLLDGLGGQIRRLWYDTEKSHWRLTKRPDSKIFMHGSFDRWRGMTSRRNK